MKVPIPVHPLFPVFLLSLLVVLSPACVKDGKVDSTTPAAGGPEATEPATDGSPQQDPEATPPADEPADAPPEKVAPVDAPPEATGSGALSTEEQALLNYHNRVRAEVKVAALTWSDKLKGVAAAWGQKLVAKGCVMEHSQGSGYGENLYMGSAEVFTMEDAAKSWESEKKYYTGAPLNGSNWYKSGHYTQMVWSQTTEVGCAKVTCRGSLIVICNYSPAGNFMGQKAY